MFVLVPSARLVADLSAAGLAFQPLVLLIVPGLRSLNPKPLALSQASAAEPCPRHSQPQLGHQSKPLLAGSWAVISGVK